MRRLTARTEIDRFVARCVEATARPDPAPAIERDLRRLVADPGGVLRSLPGDGDEETVLHASDGLTVVRVDGDLFVGTPRSLWVPGTHERRPYTDDAYVALARSAADPPAYGTSSLVRGCRRGRCGCAGRGGGG